MANAAEIVLPGNGHSPLVAAGRRIEDDAILVGDAYGKSDSGDLANTRQSALDHLAVVKVVRHADPLVDNAKDDFRGIVGAFDLRGESLGDAQIVAPCIVDDTLPFGDGYGNRHEQGNGSCGDCGNQRLVKALDALPEKRAQ
ncbi:MAG: hypothetical protein HY246_04640 [Proteobacteria bacterium]|nr:hypothetical protein [Pseudomonadota bacterium]